MATTVVSFLGTGRKADSSSPSGYLTTTYRFVTPQGNEFFESTSLFGTGLIRFLKQLGTQIDRWIVLGTSASLWSELNQVIPSPDSVLEDYAQIDELVTKKAAEVHALQRWQGVLNAHSPSLELCLCLTGEALDPASQQQVVSAIFGNIIRGNEIVFDISNGFRHQPIIATFIVSLMRWTHDIRRVRFFSGVHDAREANITPVLELPICQQLLEATEAAAILDVTGNYEPVARCLDLDAETAWFYESTNQLSTAKRLAHKLCHTTRESADVIERELAELLRDRLEWSANNQFADRVLKSAKTALSRGEYTRAAILTYEGLLIRTIKLLSPGADLLDYKCRESGEETLMRSLSGNDSDLFMNLKNTRNACAHGTRSSQESVQRIMQGPAAFRELLNRAFKLYEKLEQLLTT